MNLAPRDARWLYFWSDPQVPPGWTMAAGVVEAPGSIVRVRTKDEPAPPVRGYAKKVLERASSARRRGSEAQGGSARLIAGWSPPPWDAGGRDGAEGSWRRERGARCAPAGDDRFGVTGGWSPVGLGGAELRGDGGAELRGDGQTQMSISVTRCLTRFSVHLASSSRIAT